MSKVLSSPPEWHWIISPWPWDPQVSDYHYLCLNTKGTSSKTSVINRKCEEDFHHLRGYDGKASFSISGIYKTNMLDSISMGIVLGVSRFPPPVTAGDMRVSQLFSQKYALRSPHRRLCLLPVHTVAHRRSSDMSFPSKTQDCVCVCVCVCTFGA